MCELPPVPEVLHSAFDEGPFRSCVACGGDLTDPERIYQVQKAWRHGEVVFELALCADCAAATVREFSRESLERMQTFFAARLRPSPRLDLCHLCGEAPGPEGEYEVAGACRGPFLLRPVVVACGKCTAASQELLSRKTRDAWGDFVDRNLPGVPAEMEPAPISVPPG